jgi:hypothetical protein
MNSTNKRLLSLIRRHAACTLSGEAAMAEVDDDQDQYPHPYLKADKDGGYPVNMAELPAEIYREFTRRLPVSSANVSLEEISEFVGSHFANIRRYCIGWLIGGLDRLDTKYDYGTCGADKGSWKTLETKTLFQALNDLRKFLAEDDPDKDLGIHERLWQRD